MTDLKRTLRLRFLTGLAILVPLVVTGYLLWGFFAFVDGWLSPLYDTILGRHVPGLGFLTTVALIFVVGTIATVGVGKRILLLAEQALLQIPFVKHIYSAVKQLARVFSPGGAAAFTECVLVEHPRKGEFSFGFLTGEFTLAHPGGEGEPLVTVYIPTNNLYLGDVVLVRREDVIRTHLSVQEGIRIILSGGTAVPEEIRVRLAMGILLPRGGRSA